MTDSQGGSVPPQQPHPTQPYPQQPNLPPGSPPPQQPYPPAASPPQAAVPPQAPRSRGRLLLFLSLSLVLVLALGAGTAWIVARLSSGDGGPTDDGRTASDGVLETAWALDYAGQNAGSSSAAGDSLGAWLVGDNVVRAQNDGVLAYRISDGSQAWSAPTPDGKSLCMVAQDFADGHGALAYGSDSGCDTMAGLDVNTGKLTWTAQVPAKQRGGDGRPESPYLLVAGQHLIVQIDNELHGYGLADGKPQWTLSPENCILEDARATADHIAFVADCDDGRSLAAIDPATGKIQWEQPLDEKDRTRGVLTVKPLVTTSGLTMEGFASRDEAGKVVATFDNPLDGTRLDTLSRNRSALVYSFLIDDTTLYLRTFPQNVPGKFRQENKIIAVDLATGKARWVSDGHSDGEVALVRVDDQGLLAWEAGDWRDLAPRLVRIDRNTGKTSVVAEAPMTAGTDGEKAQILERDGIVIIVPWEQIIAKRAITVLR